MATILDHPHNQAFLRAAGNDPEKKIWALEQIILQHDQNEKLDRAIKSALLYPKVISGLFVTGLALVVLRRIR
jgi:type II secretory pathway component PulF